MIHWVNEVLSNHIAYLPYVSFGLLMLAGLNVPISEDLIVITSGILASTYHDTVNPYFLYIAIYAGAYLGDFVSYFLGYYLGDKIFTQRPFNRWIHPKLLERVSNYIHKYGVVTLLVGRFIPFGVRNTLFLTCGLSKMKLRSFALADATAVLISTGLSFSLSYRYGYIIAKLLKEFQRTLLIVVVVGIVAYLLSQFFKKKPQN